PGVFDHHGRGRKNGGALDDLFGVQHGLTLKPSDIFSERLWVETDQDANFSYSSYQDLLSNKNTNLRHPSGFARAVRKLPTDNNNSFGDGAGVLMNLSPQWYHVLRGQGFEKAKARSLFMKHLRTANVTARVRIANPTEASFTYEITYWKQNDRILLFLIMNPEVTGSSAGGGNSQGLKTEKIKVTLKFENPIKQVRNERKDQDLADGDEFTLDWINNEAVVLSYKLDPREKR
ncbi:MAG: hypothetical protein GXP30_10865, partial [Verrucomicrobia bacterium]|nr:hypothetical protein [Verrucomicrobiota bacterium]